MDLPAVKPSIIIIIIKTGQQMCNVNNELNYSKPLVCISTLLHHYRICPTAMAAWLQPHTHTQHTRIWRSCPTEVSIPHGESFLALSFTYPLFNSLQSRQRYPTPGLLMDIPRPSKLATGQQLYNNELIIIM